MYHIEKLPNSFVKDLKSTAKQILKATSSDLEYRLDGKDLAPIHKKTAARALIKSDNDTIMKEFAQMQYNLMKPALSSEFNPINIDIDLKQCIVRFSKIYGTKLQSSTIPLYDYIVFCRLMYGAEMLKKVGITISQKDIMKPLTTIGDLTSFINKHTYEARHQLARYLVAHSRSEGLSDVEKNRIRKLLAQYKEMRTNVGRQPIVSALHSRYLDNAWPRAVIYSLFDRAFLFEADAVRCQYDGEIDSVIMCSGNEASGRPIAQLILSLAADLK